MGQGYGGDGDDQVDEMVTEEAEEEIEMMAQEAGEKLGNMFDLNRNICLRSMIIILFGFKLIGFFLIERTNKNILYQSFIY